jgi:hypothetical protein
VGKRRAAHRVLMPKHGRDHLVDLGIDGRIVLLDLDEIG